MRTTAELTLEGALGQSFPAEYPLSWLAALNAEGRASSVTDEFESVMGETTSAQ